MSSIMRRRNGLIAWSVMGRLLSGVRVATPHLQTGRASYLSPRRALGGGALPRERFSPLARNGPPAMSDLSPLSGVKRKSDFRATGQLLTRPRSENDPSQT